MPLSSVIGQSQASDGREAGSQAALQALEKAGRSPVILGIVIASHNLPFSHVVAGASALLGDTPLIGFTTSAEIIPNGVQQRSVVIALLLGNEITSRCDYWAGFDSDSRDISQRMVQSLLPDRHSGVLLVFADGFHGEPIDLIHAIPAGPFTLAGALSGGALRQARTYQLGGQQVGHGGLAAAFLGGKITAGVGVGHGWQEAGAYFQITRTRGPWIRSINNQTAAEVYAQWLGYQPREWSFPPLNEMIRLYPLGIEQGDFKNIVVRSPLRMESDGSLRMHSAVQEGATAHLLVGSMEACLKSAEKAALQALKALGTAKPILGIVLPDISWQMLLATQPGAEIAVIRKVLGSEVPILGGYTFGQITNPNHTAELFNQHIEVILIGEITN